MLTTTPNMTTQYLSVCMLHTLQMDILEHKEVQLKGSEKRVNGLEQQVEQLQTELSRCYVLLCRCIDMSTHATSEAAAVISCSQHACASIENP